MTGNTITSYPVAGYPLPGNAAFPVWQGGGQRYVSLDALAASIAGLPTAWPVDAAGSAASAAQSAAIAQIAASQTLASSLLSIVGVFDNAYASTLPKGVMRGTVGGAAITGATVGTYALTPTGGSIAGVEANLVVDSATSAHIEVVNNGRGTGTTPPTWAKPAGATLPAGTTLTAVVDNLVANQKTYWAASSDSSALLLCGNNGGAFATAPFGGTQVVFYGKAGVDAVLNNTLAALQSSLATIAGTAQIGVTTTPVTGSNIATGSIYLMETPVGAYATAIQSIKGFVVTPGNITISRYTKDGTKVALVQSYTFASGAAGAKTWTAADFGTIPVIPGEYIGVSVGTTGALTYIASVVAGAGYYPVSGTTAGALNGTNHLEVQVNYTTQTVIGADVQASKTNIIAQAQAEAVLPAYTVTGRCGVSADPVGGTSLGAGTFLLEAPVTTSGYVQSIKFFASAYGNVTVSRYTKSGSTVALVQSYTLTVVKPGLQLFTPLDFGQIPVNAGDYWSISASGIGTYNSGTVSGAGFYAVTGTSVGGLTTSSHLEFQVIYASANALPASVGNPLVPVQAIMGTGQCGIAATPVTGTAIGTGTVYVLEKQVAANALYLTSIKVFGLSAGSFTLYRYRIVAGVPTQIAAYTIPVAAGANVLTRAHFGDIPVNGGEWLAIDGGGAITFNSGTVAGGSYRVISGGGTILNNLTTATHLEIQINYATAAALSPAPRNSPTSSAAAAASDARSMTSYRAKLAKLRRGVNTPQKIKIGLGGDSWHEQTAIAQQFANICYAKLGGKAGEGWISVNSASGLTVPLNASTFAKNGTWTLYDASSGALPPTGGCAPDGMCLYTTSATVNDWVTFTATATEFRIYYAKLAGAFRYQVDGGAWTTITPDGSNGLGILTISGLSNAAHTIKIECSVNTGTVLIDGCYATMTNGSGVEVLKMGNTGATAIHYNNIAAYIAPILADIGLDAYFMCLGTNDKRATTTTADGLALTHTTIKAQVVTAKADCAYVAVIPAQTTTAADIYPIFNYRDAVAAWAPANNAEFVNLCDLFRDATTENAAGMLQGDLLHENDDGGYRAAMAYYRTMLTPFTDL